MPSKSKDPQPMSEDAIRQRAYLMWEADGRPDGMADHYWMRAAAPDEAVHDGVAETARQVRKAMKDEPAPKATSAKPAKTAAAKSTAAKPAAKKAAASKISAPAVKAKAASKPPAKKPKKD